MEPGPIPGRSSRTVTEGQEVRHGRASPDPEKMWSDQKSIAQVLLPPPRAIDTGYQETVGMPVPAVFDSRSWVVLRSRTG